MIWYQFIYWCEKSVAASGLFLPILHILPFYPDPDIERENNMLLFIGATAVSMWHHADFG